MTVPDLRDSLVRNEQAKLTATYANGVAIALAALGGIAPWIAVLQGASTSLLSISIGSLVCGLLSLALHVLGRRFLTRLDST